MVNGETIQNKTLTKKFLQFLDERKCRKTPERFRVLTQALGFSRHFSVEELCQSLENSGYYVSRATVYNTVELMCEAEVLRRLSINGNHVRYELSNATSMIHVVCTSCGKIKDVRDSAFAAQMQARKFTAFTTGYYTLCVYGTCNACARKQRKTSRPPAKPK